MLLLREWRARRLPPCVYLYVLHEQETGEDLADGYRRRLVDVPTIGLTSVCLGFCVSFYVPYIPGLVRKNGRNSRPRSTVALFARLMF